MPIEVIALAEQIGQLFAKLTPATKVFFGAATVIVVSLFIVMIALWKPVGMSPLYTQLDPADAARIVDELKSARVEYRLADNGTTVLVPGNRVPEVRVQMAGKGLPTAGVVGFEKFDKSKMGVTETGMRIDFQRALEGELTRTLMGFSEVKAARVHLVMPRESSFLSEPEPASASVVLHLEPGQFMSESQTRGVVHLVSHAVENLSAENVTVTDGVGNILYGPQSDSMVSGEQLAYKRKVERELETKVVRILEKVYGIGSVEAAATVEIEFAKISKQAEVYTPSVGDKGVIKSEKLTEDNKETSAGGGGGVPGTFSNIPGYSGVIGGDGGNTETSTSSSADREYEVNREVIETTLPSGAILSRSISIVITDDAFSDAKRQETELLVASAIGARITAGDKIVVTGKPPAASTPPEVVLRDQRIGDYIRIAAAAILIILALFVLRGIVNTISPNLKLALEGADITEEIPDLDFAIKALEERMDEAEAVVVRKIKEGPKSKHTQMREEVIRQIEENPSEVVKIIRNWLLED